MERSKIITNGDLERLYDRLSVLEEKALKFYGAKYGKYASKGINKYNIVEIGENENIETLLREMYPDLDENWIAGVKDAKGLTCDFDNNPTIYIAADLHDYGVTHEIFGHGGCSFVKNRFEIDDHIIKRNGIQYYTDDSLRKAPGSKSVSVNGALNEGFMNLIAGNALNMPINTKSMYALSESAARYIYEILGHDVVMDSLVMGKERIADEYNKGLIGKSKNVDEFQQLSKMLSTILAIDSQLGTMEHKEPMLLEQKRLIKANAQENLCNFVGRARR